MVTQPKARDLIPAFGAEIVGVDPGTWLDGDTIRFLREVFDDRGLLLFRDVDVDVPTSSTCRNCCGDSSRRPRRRPRRAPRPRTRS